MFKINLLNNFYFTTKFSQLVKSRLLTHGGAGAKAPDLLPLSEAAPAKRIFAGASFLVLLIEKLKQSHFRQIEISEKALTKIEKEDLLNRLLKANQESEKKIKNL